MDPASCQKCICICMVVVAWCMQSVRDCIILSSLLQPTYIIYVILHGFDQNHGHDSSYHPLRMVDIMAHCACICMHLRRCIYISYLCMYIYTR